MLFLGGDDDDDEDEDDDDDDDEWKPLHSLAFLRREPCPLNFF